MSTSALTQCGEERRRCGTVTHDLPSSRSFFPYDLTDLFSFLPSFHLHTPSVYIDISFSLNYLSDAEVELPSMANRGIPFLLPSMGIYLIQSYLPHILRISAYPNKFISNAEV